MVSYQSKNEIQNQVRNLLPYQIKECRECDELPKALEELIKHNYQAAFVCYDKKSNCIEVGVEKEEEVTAYPEITVHKIPLKKAVSELAQSLRNDDLDLKFYGRLLAGYGNANKIEDVVLV
ncbi:hypothetical protein ACXYMT_05900 [Salinimicrobium sp. CAU 1759]